MSKQSVLIVLIGILVVAAGLRLYGLDRQSLWYDEVAEETGFERQFLVKTPALKPYTPPLNLFFIYAMTQMLPGSDLALRIVPFIFGLMSVPIFYLLGKRLFNEQIGLISSFLLSISPFHIWYSQDARMYPLQWMLALISLIFFLRSLEQPCLKNLSGYVISSIAGLYTHQLTVFLIFLQLLYISFFLNKYRAHIFKWLGAFAIIALLYVPWIIHSLTSHIEGQAGTAKTLDFKLIIYTIYSYCAGFSIGPSLKELHLNRSLTVMAPYLTETIALMTVFCSLFLVGLWSLRKDHSQLMLLMLLLIVPIAGLLVLNIYLPNLSYNVRYTGTAFFGFLLFLSKGIEWVGLIKPKTLGKALVVSAYISVTAISAYSYSNYQFDNKYHKPDFRGAVNYINGEIRNGDSVLCLINSGVIDRYAKNKFRCSNINLIAISDKTDMDIVMRKFLYGEKRLWLVLSNEWYSENVEKVKKWSDTNYEEIKSLRRDSHDIANIRIYAYDITMKKS